MLTDGSGLYMSPLVLNKESLFSSPSYQSVEDKLVNTGPASQITPELGHKPLLCLQIGLHRARRHPASIGRSQARHNGFWRTLAGPLLRTVLWAAASSRCTVCARQNYLVEDCVLCLVDFAPACFARAVPVSGAPAQLQHLHLASITKPCYCRVAAPSLHSVCTPEFGFVASSEITNQTHPKSSTAHIVFDGQQVNWNLLCTRHLSDCGLNFLLNTQGDCVSLYKKITKVFNQYTKQPDITQKLLHAHH